MEDTPTPEIDPAILALIPEEGIRLIEELTQVFRAIDGRESTTDDERQCLRIAFAIVLSAITRPEVLDLAHAALQVMQARMQAEGHTSKAPLPQPRLGESARSATLRGMRRRPRGH